MIFYSFDFDLDPVILVFKLDLDTVKTYGYIEKEVLASVV